MNHHFIPIETARLVWRDNLPFSQDFDDIYFSTENGLAETEHVFIEGNQLIKRWNNLPNQPETFFIIAETGFGSGLNFLLSWSLWVEHAPKNAKLYFFSCEKFPLTKKDLKRSLDLWPQLQKQAEGLIENYPVLTPGFHQLQFDDGRINLTLMLGEATACFKELLICGDAELEGQLRRNFVDAWFLDGFAPAKNQEMWSRDLLELIALLSKPGTSLATFSAASLVRQNLEATGFQVQKIKGFARKRDMVTAQFKGLESLTKKWRTTPWYWGGQPFLKTKKAIVLGAGLAGCYTAYALAKRGWQVILIDENDQIGQGASANRQAVLYPKFSAYRSPLTLLMLTAFLYAVGIYKKILDQVPIGDLSGILQLAFNSKQSQCQESLSSWLAIYPELAELIDAQEASLRAGIELDSGGLFIKGSGWLNSTELCHFLTRSSKIEFLPKTVVSELIYNDCWQVAEHSAEVLVIANGYQANQFIETAYLPLKPIRGQMTSLAANKESLALKIPLCGNGHILPAQGSVHGFGASYQVGNADKSSLLADDKSNLMRLSAMPTKTVWSNELRGNWVGIRGATSDYLPLVGPVPDEKEFISRFTSLTTNAKRWLTTSGPYLPGLYLCAGFGSRGLTTIPLCAEWLASLINNEPSQIPMSLIKALAPARFLLKKIVRSMK